MGQGGPASFIGVGKESARKWVSAYRTPASL
jgi:hypothetical protein